MASLASATPPLIILLNSTSRIAESSQPDIVIPEDIASSVNIFRREIPHGQGVPLLAHRLSHPLHSLHMRHSALIGKCDAVGQVFSEIKIQRFRLVKSSCAMRLLAKHTWYGDVRL
jgi:hypothetical protein